MLVNERNVDEAANRIWNAFSSLGLEAALSAVDSLKPGDNGYEFKEELKEELRKKANSGCIDDFSLNEKDDCWNNDALCIENKCVKFEDIGWRKEVLDNVNLLMSGYEMGRAVFELGELNAKETIPILIKMLEKDISEGRVSDAFISLLGLLKSEEAVPLLLSILGNLDQNEFMRQTAAVALANIGSHEAVLGLLHSLEVDHSYDVKETIIASLGELRVEEAVPALIKILDHRTPIYEEAEVQLQAVVALRKIGSTDAVPALKRAERYKYNSFFEKQVELALLSLDPVRRKSVYSIATRDPELPPNQVLELMRTSPLFEKVYNNDKLKTFEVPSRSSIAILVFKRIMADYSDFTEQDALNSPMVNALIEDYIDILLDKRNTFSKRVILGPDTNLFIIFYEKDDKIDFDPTTLIDFAKARGVSKIYVQKGSDDKDKFSELIKQSSGPTTIFVDAHGYKKGFCLHNPRLWSHLISFGVFTSNGPIGFLPGVCGGYDYKEMADIFYQRGNLNEVNYYLNSCYGYDQAENIINDLKKRMKTKQDTPLPIIITAANKGKLSSGSTSDQLNKLNLAKNEPLTGEYIYKLEQSTFDYQDLAVFQDSTEIALNSLNHDCLVCEGDNCPISS